MSFSGISTAEIGDPIPDHLHKLSQPNTSAEDVSIDDIEDKEHSGLFFEGYDRILSKLYLRDFYRTRTA
jgi:hypothetical protein